MTQTELAPEEYEQDNQDISQSRNSSESVEDSKEKFKVMIHKILGVADKKQIDKICCFIKINKQWSLTRQLFCTYSLFLTFFMITILGYFVFYLKFSPNYVGDSILQEIDESINANFLNSLQEYSKQVHQYLKSYSTWMIMFSQIFSNYARWSTSLYEDQDYMYINTKGRYQKMNEILPADLIDQKYSNKPPYNKPISFETFNYLSLHPDDQVQLSAATKTILDQVDILSYFFRNFIIDPNISYIQSLYLFIEERDTICFYPCGLKTVSGSTKLDSRQRPWYINAQKTFLINGYKPSFTITGPYQDLTTQQKTLTYSWPIVKQDQPNEIAALINIDIIVNNFKSVYDLLQQNDGMTRIALIDYSSELIINDCFQSPQIITFYETEVTGFNKANWDEINDWSLHSQDSIFIIQDLNQTKYYFARTLIKDNVDTNTNKFILIIFGEQSNYLSYKYDIQDKINKELYTFCISIIIAISVIWFFGYIFIYFFAKQTVEPLAKLSNLAKSINKNEERKSSTEDIKQQLGKIQGADANTKKLIDSFINLVDQHSGMRKLANGNGYQDNQIPVYNKLNSNNENYPRNDYKGDMDDTKEQLRSLKNFEAGRENDEDDDDDYDVSNQDIDEVCGENSKYNSCSSMHSNKCPNEDDNTEEDNLNNKCKHKNKHNQQEIEENENNIDHPKGLMPSKMYESKKEKKYFKWIKEQLTHLQDNDNAKLSLSLQLLSSFLPQNTQSI